MHNKSNILTWLQPVAFLAVAAIMIAIGLTASNNKINAYKAQEAEITAIKLAAQETQHADLLKQAVSDANAHVEQVIAEADAQIKAQIEAEIEAERLAAEKAAKEQAEKIAKNPSSAIDLSSANYGQISVDFGSLQSLNSDVVGYIYSAGTAINYPILYTPSSNDYYLHKNIYHQDDVNGSIFIEHLNSSSFSDNNTILYGHNMRNGSMFASLNNYKSQSYYNAHPCLYIYTPSQNYRLDLFAGCVVAHDDPVFATSLTSEDIQHYMANSTFSSALSNPSGRYVTMCTCTYEFNNARYVVLGQLNPI